jgi:hypothetical protein
MRNGTPASLTINDLERMLAKRRSALEEVMRERAQLQKRMDALDVKIRSLSGGARASGLTGGGRARNAMSLVAAMSEVLTKADKPLSVGDIVEKVQAAGYHSNAANFRALVNQTLIKQRKLFAKAGRGIYQIKK